MSFVYGNKLINGNRPQLRRQKSTLELMNPPTSVIRDRKILQKQLTVDATPMLSLPKPQNNVYSSEACSSISENRKCSPWTNSIVENDYCSSTLAQQSNELHGLVTVAGGVSSKLKKRSQGNNKNEIELNEKLKKALKERSNRVNLNIFLSASSEELEHAASDNESMHESPSQSIKKNTCNVPADAASTCLILEPLQNTEPDFAKPKDMSNNNNPPHIVSTNNDSNTEENSTPAPQIENNLPRRPPLVRAMSAPIRPIDDNLKNMMQVKRKIRKKKINLRDREDNTAETFFEMIPNQQAPEVNKSTASSITVKTQKKNIPRPRSAIGSEVVTLVSLLSSGGSDSEKEDKSIGSNINLQELAASTTIPTVSHGPLLRKIGKTVSFQEDDMKVNFTTHSSKEFSNLFRRGSVAPLVTRNRANRPPTAPPGYSYNSEIENNIDLRNTFNDRGEPCYKKINECNMNNEKEPEEIEIFPDYVTTLKERECWKLFKKMSNCGISVTYETVLRGMLTPTEFRALQKQKDIEALKSVQEDIQNNEQAKI